MSIPRTRLGSTGLAVSRLALGTMTFGLQTDEATSQRILDKALGAGVDFIDTADVYPLGGTLANVGETEAIIGRWLQAGGPQRRQAVVLATKAVGRMGPHPWNQGASRKHLLAAKKEVAASAAIEVIGIARGCSFYHGYRHPAALKMFAASWRSLFYV